MASLKDQLLKNGLIDPKKAKQADKEKRKEAKVSRRTGEVATDEVKLAAEKARLEKQARDRELNIKLQEEKHQREIVAQIKQLIERHRQPKLLERGDEGVEYNFTSGKLIKKIRVSERVREQLARGILGIGILGENFELLPRVVAEKIAERDPSFIVIAQPSTSIVEEDDPYKDYVIPDDLMW